MAPHQRGTILMPDISFVLVYVDEVARSEAFYAAILGRLRSNPRRLSPCCPPGPV
jgi:hypothetical protein